MIRIAVLTLVVLQAITLGLLYEALNIATLNTAVIHEQGQTILMMQGRTYHYAAGHKPHVTSILGCPECSEILRNSGNPRERRNGFRPE